MGIKGRRKRLRDREMRLLQESTNNDNDKATNLYDVNDDSNSYESQYEERVDALHNKPATIPSRIATSANNKGPYSLPFNAHGELKLKKSELYKLNDMDYLDRVREEHANRRTTHLSRQSKEENNCYSKSTSYIKEGGGDSSEMYSAPRQQKRVKEESFTENEANQPSENDSIQTKRVMYNSVTELRQDARRLSADELERRLLPSEQELMEEHCALDTNNSNNNNNKKKNSKSVVSTATESVQDACKKQALKCKDNAANDCNINTTSHNNTHMQKSQQGEDDVKTQKMELSCELEHTHQSTKVASGGLFAHPLLGLHSSVVHSLNVEGFTHMTRIQERCIPYLLDGYDILAQARTGSGKTLAFCVPILHSIIAHNSKHTNSTVALLMAPTKELCVQTHSVLQRLCEHVNAAESFTDDVYIKEVYEQGVAKESKNTIRSDNYKKEMFCGANGTSEHVITVGLITGGTKVIDERRKLTSGLTIVVGTPGRIHDHVTHCTSWTLTHVRFLVLDEADRMMADGFQRDLDAIIAKLPRSRQTCLFSATNTKSVHTLARLSLARTPIFVRTTGNAPTPLLLTNNDNDDINMASSTNEHNEHVKSKLEDDNDDDDKENDDSSNYNGELTLPPYRTFHEHSSVTSINNNNNNNNEGSDNSDNCNDDNDDEEDDMSSNEYEDSENEGAEAIPPTLRQYCHIVPLQTRLINLYLFVKRVARTSKAMIFCSTVASTTFHFQMMGSVGFHDQVMMLHGHMKHRQRLQTFQIFSEWQTGVLFCTDVAARGLDIPHVEWILQYDPPLDPTEYIHRIGRTARAGNVGNALLFLTPEEAEFVLYLRKFDITLFRYEPLQRRLPQIQEKLEHVLQLDPVVAKSAITAFRAHVGAYQSHILRDTFNVHRLNLHELAAAFALTSPPHVTLPKTNAADEKRQEYVKGKLKSLNRRRMDALKHYEAYKDKQQWHDGVFIGVRKPSLS